MLNRVALVLCWAVAAFGQNAALNKPPAAEFPILAYAAIPTYPAVAWSAHFGGTVDIEVTVEKGIVVNAQVKRGTVVAQLAAEKITDEELQRKLLPYLSLPSLANVKTWKFEGEGRASFVVRYVYRIRGTQTAVPETPRIEFLLPHLIRLTAKPFKPTCSDCAS